MSQLMRSHIVVSAILTGLALPGCSSTPVSEAGDTLPDWSLSGVEAGLLGEATTMPIGEVQAPIGFRLDDGKADAGIFLWRGPRREDGTFPAFNVTFVKVLPSQYDSLEDAIEEGLVSIREMGTQWSNTKPERGKINGCQFVRSTWKIFTDKSWKKKKFRKMRGVLYLTIHRGYAIQLLFYDVVPEVTEVMEVGELAIRSFKGV